MTRSHKQVILFYKGNYALKTIDSRWQNLFIPLRHIGSYINGVEDVDSDEDIEFVPSGQRGTKDGVEHEIWKEKQP